MARRPDIDIKELKEPDAFMEGVGSSVRYVRENRAIVIAAVVGIAALFCTGVWWRTTAVRQYNSTAAAFLRATDALAGDNLSAADAALVNVAASGVAPYDEFASLYSAEILVRRGELEQARAIYERIAGSAGTSYLRQIAIVGKAHTLEEEGKAADALTAFAQAGQINGPYREPALRGQLRTATATDNNDQARAAIETLLEKYPGAEDADQLSLRLATLGGSAQS